MASKQVSRELFDKLVGQLIRKGLSRNQAIAAATRRFGENPHKPPPRNPRPLQGGGCGGR